MVKAQKHRSLFETNKYLAALGLLILSSIYIPSALDGKLPVHQLAPLVSLICFVLLFMSAKKMRNVLPALVVYLYLYAVVGDSALGSIAILIYTAVSLASNEIILSGKKWKSILLYASLPISLALAYVFSKSVILCISVTLPYILFALLGICVKKKMNRKSVIIILSSALLLFAFAMLGACMLIYSVSFEQLKDGYASIRDELISYVANFTLELNGDTVALFGENQAMATEILVGMSNVMPAAIVISMIIISFCLYNFQASMLEKFGGDEYITPEILKIYISAAAAAVYLITFIFSLTTDSYGGVPFGSVVCQNIYIILTPALAFSGFTTVRDFCKKKKMRFGLLFLVPMILLAVLGYLFTVLAAIGMICIFAKTAKAYADKKD